MEGRGLDDTGSVSKEYIMELSLLPLRWAVKASAINSFIRLGKSAGPRSTCLRYSVSCMITYVCGALQKKNESQELHRGQIKATIIAANEVPNWDDLAALCGGKTIPKFSP